MFLASLLISNALIVLYYCPRHSKTVCQGVSNIFPALSNFMFWMFPVICCVVYVLYLGLMIAVLLLPMYIFSHKTIDIVQSTVRGLNVKQFVKLCCVAGLVSIMMYVFQNQYSQRGNLTRDELYSLSCYTWAFMMAFPLVIIMW